MGVAQRALGAKECSRSLLQQFLLSSSHPSCPRSLDGRPQLKLLRLLQNKRGAACAVQLAEWVVGWLDQFRGQSWIKVEARISNIQTTTEIWRSAKWRNRKQMRRYLYMRVWVCMLMGLRVCVCVCCLSQVPALVYWMKLAPGPKSPLL